MLITDKELGPIIKKLIDTSKHKIQLIAYAMTTSHGRSAQTHAAIWTALKSAATRGLECRAIMETRKGIGANAPTKDTAVLELMQAGFKVKPKSSGQITHSKIWIFDEITLVVGSHNITKNSLENNHEASLLTSDTTDLRDAVKYFRQIWDKS